MNAPLPPLPRNWQELRDQLSAEIVRGEKYLASTGGDTMFGLRAGPEYVRGGRQALEGVIRTIDRIISETNQCPSPANPSTKK